METKLKDARIADSLFLLSRENYWDAIKIAYDVLINETFRYGKEELGHKQHDLEVKGKEILCLLYDFLKSRNVVNVADVLSEIRLLTIYFNNYSRESLSSTAKNNKVKVLTMNLIGLLNFLDQTNNSAQYFFGKIDTQLNREIQNNITEETFALTTPYFEVYLLSKETFEENFWDELEKFDPIHVAISVFSETEYTLLMEYKKLVETHQLEILGDDKKRIEEIWGTHLQREELKKKITAQYHLLHLFEEFEEFRKSDKSSGKYNKNVYKEGKEAAFHKNIYPYLCRNQNYDLVFSEFASGNQRFDILLYSARQALSAIVELKVNELKKLDENINQLIKYIDEVEDKPHHYIEPPNIGVLMTYYIGEERLANIDLTTMTGEFSSRMIKVTNNFYLLKPDEDDNYPILIGVFNGIE